MLESPEARAKLRHKLETWPDDRKCPVTINQALELLNMVERLEKNSDWMAKYLISQIKTCPTIKAYRCKQQDNMDFPVSECVKCWREAVRQYAEWD